MLLNLAKMKNTRTKNFKAWQLIVMYVLIKIQCTAATTPLMDTLTTPLTVICQHDTSKCHYADALTDEGYNNYIEVPSAYRDDITSSQEIVVDFGGLIDFKTLYIGNMC